MPVSKRFKREARREVRRLRRERATELGPSELSPRSKSEIRRAYQNMQSSKSKIMAALDGVPPTHPSSRGLEKGTRSIIQGLALIETALKGM